LDPAWLTTASETGETSVFIILLYNSMAKPKAMQNDLNLNLFDIY